MRSAMDYCHRLITISGSPIAWSTSFSSCRACVRIKRPPERMVKERVLLNHPIKSKAARLNTHHIHPGTFLRQRTRPRDGH